MLAVGGSMDLRSTKHDDSLQFMKTKYIFLILIGLTALMLFAAQLLVQFAA